MQHGSLQTPGPPGGEPEANRNWGEKPRFDPPVCHAAPTLIFWDRAAVDRSCVVNNSFRALPAIPFEEGDPRAGIYRDHRSAFNSAAVREKRTLPRSWRSRA